MTKKIREWLRSADSLRQVDTVIVMLRNGINYQSSSKYSSIYRIVCCSFIYFKLLMSFMLLIWYPWIEIVVWIEVVSTLTNSKYYYFYTFKSFQRYSLIKVSKVTVITTAQADEWRWIIIEILSISSCRLFQPCHIQFSIV